MTTTSKRFAPVQQRNPEGKLQLFDPASGHWLPDPPVLQPRPSAQELVHAYNADAAPPPALPEVRLDALDPLENLPLFTADPAKTQLRERHAARLDELSRQLPNFQEQVTRSRQRLGMAEVSVLNGLRSECALERGTLLEAENDLRRAEHEATNLGNAIAALDAELRSEHDQQHRARRWTLEDRLKKLAARQHALLTQATKVQEVAARLVDLRRGLLEPDEQRVIGAIGAEWTYTYPGPLLERLQAALHQDHIVIEPGA